MTYQRNGHNGDAREAFQRGREEARAIGAMVADIAQDVRGLAFREVQLARAEAQETMSNTLRAVIWAGVAAVLGFLLLTWISLTAMFALAEVWPFWLASLATTGGVLLLTLIAGGLAYRRMKKISIAPQRTMQTLREDMTWARSQMTSPGRSEASARQ